MKCRRRMNGSPGGIVSSKSPAACPVCFCVGGTHDEGCSLSSRGAVDYGTEPCPVCKYVGRHYCDSAPLPKRESVDHPTHYTDSPAHCLQCKRPIECVDVAEHWGFN